MEGDTYEYSSSSDMFVVYLFEPIPKGKEEEILKIV